MTRYVYYLVGSLMVNFCLLILIFFSLLPAYAQEPSINRSQQIQSEINELKQKMMQLENKIESNNNANQGDELLQQVIPIITIVGTAAGTFLAWRRERKIPPTAEQDRIINDIATQWYSRRHLEAYNKIWKEIENTKAEDQEKVVEWAWNKLCVKEFPKDIFPEREVINDIADYLKDRLHIKKDALIKRMQPIIDASSVEYYHVVSKNLPVIADIAVLATVGDRNVLEQGYEKVVEESLRKVKRLMVFYRLREDKKVVDIVLGSAVSKKIST